MAKEKVEKYTNISVFIYIIAFTLYGFVARIIPLYMLINEPVNSYVFILFAAAGCGLILLDVIKGRYLFRGRYCWILYIFISVMIISSFLNIQYGYSDNLKTIVWTCIQVAIFYSAYTRITKEKMMKFLYFFFHVIVWIWTIAIIYSLKQFVVMDGYSEEIWPNEWRMQGFRFNRLFGIFNDPNYAAVTCVYVVFMLLYIAQKTKKKWLKLICILACIVHGLYILLSGSRTAKLSTLVVVFVYIFLQLKNRWLYEKISISILKRIVVAILGVCFLAVAGNITEKLIVNIPRIYAEHIITNEEETVSSQNKTNEGEAEQKRAQSVMALDEQAILDRQDVGEGTSNRRLRTWKNYLEGVEGRYIIGASPRNVAQYMEDKHPEIYERNEGYETHNGFLSVFVGTGVIGFGVVILFMILVGRKIWVYCFSKESISKEFVTIFSIIVVILIYTFFFTELFFVNNLTTAIFWLLLGCMMYWLKNDKERIHKD